MLRLLGDPLIDRGVRIGGGERSFGAVDVGITLIMNHVVAPRFEGGHELEFDGGVFGVGGDVVDLVGINAEIEEFDVGFRGGEESGLGGVEFSLEVHDLHLGEHGVGAFFVLVELEPRPIGHEVVNQFEIAGTDRAHGVMCFVHFVASGEDVLAIGQGWAEQAFTVKRDGGLCPGGFEDGGANIERHDHVVADLLGCDLAGPAHDHRDANAAIVEELFAANMAAPVIADEEYEGVVSDPFVIEALENLTDLTIDELHLFKTISPVPAVEIGVGVVGRELNVGDVDGALGITVPEAMGATECDAGEEWLVRGTVGPVDAGEEFFLRGGRKVDVSFVAHEAGVVTCIGQEMGKGTNAVG